MNWLSYSYYFFYMITAKGLGFNLPFCAFMSERSKEPDLRILRHLVA